MINRRALLAAGIGTAIGGSVLLSPGDAHAARLFSPSVRAIAGNKIKNLSGPAETGGFAAPWTDLGIPVICPNGSMLFICGDTFSGDGVGGPDWRSPIGLRSASTDLNALVVDGSVGGAHANGLVPEGHIPIGDGFTTAIPSDVFTIGDTMYMHLMRGVIFETDHTDFWRSTDNGETWEYLCEWPGNALGGQFQQKTYAVAADGFCYVLSSVFNREIPSGLMLHRVPHAGVGDPAAYEPWGFANGAWAWGNPASTISGVRNWGEICLRVIDGRYVFSWLNMDPLSMRVQVFADPTADLTATPEQTVIVPTTPGNETGNAVASPYGGFIFPGSTVGDLHLAISQWYDNQNYRFMQYRITGVTG